MNPRSKRLMTLCIQRIVFILASIFVVFGAAVLHQESAAAEDSLYNVQLDNNDPECSGASAIEAETGKLYGDFEIVQSHGEEVVVAPNGTGTDYDNVIYEHRVEFCLTVDTDAQYRLAGRLRTPTKEENSFWVQIDDGPIYKWTTIITAVFGNDFASASRSGTPYTWELENGDHLVVVYKREDGTELDKIGLFADSDVEPSPTATDTSTATPANTPTKTPRPTKTPTETAVATATKTPKETKTATPLPTETTVPTEIPEASATPIPSVAATETQSPTSTAPPVEISTPMPSATEAVTAVSTNVPTATEPVATIEPIETASPVPTQAGNVGIRFTNTDYLLIDADGDDLVSVGDTLFYQLDLRNEGDINIENILIFDSPDPNTTFLSGSVFTDNGQIDFGNTKGDTRIQVAIQLLPSGESASISFQVELVAGLVSGPIENQAILTFDSPDAAPRTRAAMVSDDPDTQKEFDPTFTQVGALFPERSNIFLPVVAK